MIDIHCHFLPGVDDGAQTFEESGQMLDLAAANGTEAMVATPHSDLRYSFDPKRCRNLLARLSDLHRGGPRLHSGCEVHLTRRNVSSILDNPASYALNGVDCILLELPDRLLPPLADPAIAVLVESGLRVIVAHPERNLYIQSHLSYADRLLDAGCYLQLTARSMSGGFGPAATTSAVHFLRRRTAHFIASDAHGAIQRRPVLNAAFDNVSKTYGEAAARLLFHDNPAAALRGAPLCRMPAAPGWLTAFFARTLYDHRKQTPSQMP